MPPFVRWTNPPSPAVPLGAADLEQQRAEFVEGITHFPNNLATRRRISDAIGDDVYLDVMKSPGKLENGHDLVQTICLFAPLQSPWSCYRWHPHGWDWKPADPALNGRCFVELTSGEALFREEQALRHCVAGDAARCASGHSAIVSVRFQDARRITVEINPATGQVVQAKGLCNRFPSSEEQRAIQLWVGALLRLSLIPPPPGG